MTFEVLPAARIIAPLQGTTSTLSITGIKQDTTPSNAVTQLNKIVPALTGNYVMEYGMKIVRTSQAE